MNPVLKLILVTLIAWSCTAAATTTPLKLGNDGRLDLSQYRGKVVYLDFWASWCLPCRQSFGWMNKLRDAYSDKDLVIIAVNLDTDREQAQAFLDKIPARFDIVYDPDGRTAEAYQLKGMPSSFLIDRKGRVTETTVGFQHSETGKLEARIRELTAKRQG
jgi:cytochrome c biogenesis protein CcmG/thiol:disulfide interchange protein DsbE